MTKFTIASNYTGLQADFIVLKMLETDEKLTENERKRLSRFLKYAEYLLNKTYWYQSMSNKDLENDNRF